MLASCFSVSYPEPTSAELAMGRSLTPPKGQGLVVAYRKPGVSLTTGKVPTVLRIDGKPHGANRAGTFVVVPVSKGRHVVHIQHDPSAAAGISSFPINVVAGRCYFFRQSVGTESGSMLVPAGGVLVPAPVPSAMYVDSKPVTEEVGRAEVARCKQHGGTGKIEVSTWP
jgi:hypothetical protein